MPDFHHADLFNKNPKLLNGNLQIIACAGSGKTEFVSERIARQIFKGIARPEQIAAFTFTDKAFEELKFRIRSKINTLIAKQPDIGDIYIGAIHAFAFRLLQRYRAYAMLDDVGRLAFISSIRYDIDLTYLTGSLEKRFRICGHSSAIGIMRCFVRFFWMQKMKLRTTTLAVLPSHQRMTCGLRKRSRTLWLWLRSACRSILFWRVASIIRFREMDCCKERAL